MKTLYFDCFAGASGNMVLGALLALGIEPEAISEEVKKIALSEFELRISEETRAGIRAVHVEVLCSEEKTHRNLPEIRRIIENAGLKVRVKERSLGIFEQLAAAEARIHGIDPEEVHFHEVGAMDAIIDVVGSCIGFEMLEIERFICSEINIGSGFIEIAHGKYPVPPPAVVELLRGKPIYSNGIEGELITPTGAAIITTLCDRFGPLDKFFPEEIGYGAGTRDYENFPNALRLIRGITRETGEPSAPAPVTSSGHHLVAIEDLVLLETNLDDVSPEILGFVMSRAISEGALDCWFTAIQMKKNRPATKISILGRSDERDKFSRLLFTQTSTLGVRITEIKRESLPRETRRIETEFGPVEVKIARFEDRIVNIKPEYEQIRRIALKSDLSITEIEERVIRAYRAETGDKQVVGKQ